MTGLLDALLEWSRDEAGGPRLTGEGRMLGESALVGAGLTGGYLVNLRLK